jgi:DNA mismatch repair protein MutS2
LQAKTYLTEHDRLVLELTEQLESRLQKLHAIQLNFEETLQNAFRYEEIMTLMVDHFKKNQRVIFEEGRKSAQKLLRDVETEIKKLKKYSGSLTNLKEIKNKLNIMQIKSSNDMDCSTNRFEGLKKGDKLSLGKGKEGRVVAVDSLSKKVEIRAGGFRLKTDMDALARIGVISPDIPQTPKEPPSNINLTKIESTGSLSVLNVVGLTVDEALPLVEKFIDNALFYGLKEVRIIHGIGTGRLRQSIHQFLKTHFKIENFFLGALSEGGIGVTIVELEL